MQGYRRVSIEMLFIIFFFVFGPVAAALPHIPPSLQIFVDRLNQLPKPLYHRQLHSAWDFSTQSHVHAWVSKYLFEDGRSNPSLLYLGTDPVDQHMHLAVAHWHPNLDLWNIVKPERSLRKDYNHRQGLLALKLTSGEKPEFVGILWHKDLRVARSWYRRIKQSDLDELEKDERIDLNDVKRQILYHFIYPTLASASTSIQVCLS